MKKHLFTYLLIVITISCTKEKDMGVLKGDIIGKVTLLNQYEYLENNLTGTTVTIKNQEFSQTTTTDELGNFTFRNIPFGIYSAEHLHNGFLENYQGIIKHIGGNSPTLYSYQLEQIPTFEVQIDSIIKDEYTYYGYATLINAYKAPVYGFAFRWFISDKAQVSKDEFTQTTTGYGWIVSGKRIKIRLDYFDYDRTFENTNSIYLRIYPLTRNRFFRSDYIPGLGKASNIFQWKK